MADNFITVTQLNDIITKTISGSQFLSNIVICGEVQGFKVSRAHAYFNLKDEGGIISCNDFNYLTRYVPKEGEQILVKGNVSYYGPYGKLSFNISQIQPYGIGALAALYEKLKLELEKKGYFDKAHKKPIPKYPKRVCVITSKTGAVIQDIISTMRRYNDVIDIICYDCKVQGMGAEDEIAQAIKTVDDLNFDVIVVARGGGSLEDLMCFNNEKVVYAIYDAKTPIVSAVGHQTDFTLCDLASDLRCETPTAAAEMLGYKVNDIKDFIKDGQNRLINALSRMVEQKVTSLHNYQVRLCASLNDLYSKNLYNLKQYQDKICLIADNILKNKEYQLKEMCTRLDASNPTKIFTKGYLFAKTKDGQNIKSISDIKVGDKINLITNGGSATAKIEEVKNDI